VGQAFQGFETLAPFIFMAFQNIRLFYKNKKAFRDGKGYRQEFFANWFPLGMNSTVNSLLTPNQDLTWGRRMLPSIEGWGLPQTKTSYEPQPSTH